MEKRHPLLNFLAWFIGILIALVVGFAMIEGTLRIGFLDDLGAGIANLITGWVILVTTVLVTALVLFRRR